MNEPTEPQKELFRVLDAMAYVLLLTCELSGRSARDVNRMADRASQIIWSMTKRSLGNREDFGIEDLAPTWERILERCSRRMARRSSDKTRNAGSRQ